MRDAERGSALSHVASVSARLEGAEAPGRSRPPRPRESATAEIAAVYGAEVKRLVLGVVQE